MQLSYTDILIIGGGGAAARAAIEASLADPGLNITMVMKGTYMHSGATAYKASEMAGFNAGDGVADPTDSPQGHYNDIMNAAAGMSIPALSRIVADNAVDTLHTLDDWGVTFERRGDKYLAFKSCFSTKPRTHVIKGHGEPILEALGKKLKDNQKISMIENSTVAKLLISGNVCHGVLIVNDGGEISTILAKSVIMAAGGAGQVFEKNLNPPDVTGDGYALAYDAGAKMINMEFMQAGIGVSHPIISLLNAYIWAGYPIITDKDGKDFLQELLPEGISLKEVMRQHANHFPFSSSDDSYLLETLIQKRILDGFGTSEDGVYMDLQHFTDAYVQQLDDDSGIRKMWPIARAYYESHGINVLEENMQIACFAHAINGGLLIDENAASTVEGLFAAGEVAGGPHGADRLGGNMLLTCQIYGKIAAKSAVNRVHSMGEQDGLTEETLAAQMESVQELLHKDVPYESMKRRLQHGAQRHLLVRRTEDGLSYLLGEIREMQAEMESAPSKALPDLRNLDLYNMLRAAELMATAALLRRESRGAHFRADFPQKNDSEFNRPRVIYKKNDAIASSFLIDEKSNGHD